MSSRSVAGLEILDPLSREEERELHDAIVLGRRARVALATGVAPPEVRRRLIRERQGGDVAESRLLRATLGLVRRRVIERGYRFGDEELEAAGLEGLVNALARFDPSRDLRFSTYANYWITKMVNEAIRQQAGLSDAEMRTVLALGRLERQSPTRPLTEERVAQALGVARARAREALQLYREVQARRYHATHLPEALERPAAAEDPDAPGWVIDALRSACGEEFDLFWQVTFKTASLEALATSYGLTRQGMSKRVARLRRRVRDSPDAARLEAWLDQH